MKHINQIRYAVAAVFMISGAVLISNAHANNDMLKQFSNVRAGSGAGCAECKQGGDACDTSNGADGIVADTACVVEDETRYSCDGMAGMQRKEGGQVYTDDFTVMDKGCPAPIKSFKCVNVKPFGTKDLKWQAFSVGSCGLYSYCHATGRHPGDSRCKDNPPLE